MVPFLQLRGVGKLGSLIVRVMQWHFAMKAKFVRLNKISCDLVTVTLKS
jgi:hypothetical protein